MQSSFPESVSPSPSCVQLPLSAVWLLNRTLGPRTSLLRFVHPGNMFWTLYGQLISLVMSKLERSSSVRLEQLKNMPQMLPYPWSEVDVVFVVLKWLTLSSLRLEQP